MNYGLCYVITFVSAAVSVFVAAAVSYTNAYSSTLFPLRLHTVCSRAHSMQ